MTDTSDLTEPTWPREIWAAELGEYDASGDYVCSEHATVAGFEGDTEREREFHRYVDGDIFDSQKRYYATMMDGWRAENDRLRVLIADILAAGCVDPASPLHGAMMQTVEKK